VNKASGASVGVPTLNARTSNSITIFSVTAPQNGQSVEYALSTGNSAPASGWQTGTTFGSLKAETTYYIFARAVGNSNYETGAASASLSVTTMQNPQGAVIVEYYWVDEHGSLVTTNSGKVTINRGEALTISAQSAGYTVRMWHLNGVNTGQNGTSYSFSSTSAGKHTIGLFVEKDGKLYNTNITITVL
jgi:hypothetical protein